MEAFEHKEMLQDHRYLEVNEDEPKIAQPRVQIMRKVRKSGAFFYFCAIDSTTGPFKIWEQNIPPRFSNISNLKDGANKILAPYWSSDAQSVITAKFKDRDMYVERLKALFEVEDNTLLHD